MERWGLAETRSLRRTCVDCTSCTQRLSTSCCGAVSCPLIHPMYLACPVRVRRRSRRSGRVGPGGSADGWANVAPVVRACLPVLSLRGVESSDNFNALTNSACDAPWAAVRVRKLCQMTTHICALTHIHARAPSRCPGHIHARYFCARSSKATNHIALTGRNGLKIVPAPQRPPPTHSRPPAGQWCVC